MKKLIFYLLFVLLIAGCKEKFTSPVASPTTGYLVVEGFINNGPEPTTIKLSRTTKLIDTASVVYEYSAGVTIEGDNGDSYPLSENGDGVYTISSLSLNSNTKYRLHIYTAGGREYVSDFSEVKVTPPVDSISWQRDGDGVHIFINTHDPLGNTKFYQWEYEETWEFHSAFRSSLLYVLDSTNVTSAPTGVDFRFPNQSDDTTIYKCWNSHHSTNILIGSSEKLTADRIYLPLIAIKPGAVQLSVLYSVLIKQHALSSGNYQFLQKMKKNTEQLGSIFDAQPSELKGNIHCVTDPKEQVIGFVEVSQERTQRKFISNGELPGWGYSQPCAETKIPNNKDSIQRYGIGLLPTSVAEFRRVIISFFAAEPQCVDCTLRGSNMRPDFWP